MEYKYSLIGNCSKTYTAINKINSLFGDEYVRNASSEISSIPQQLVPNQVVTVYVFKNLEKGSLKIAPNRIDFIFNKINNRDIFLKLFEKISEFLPDEFSRIAININDNCLDADRKRITAFSKNDGIMIEDSSVSEFFVRKNLKTKLLGFDINNIITIQSALLQPSNDFRITNGIVFSVDVNNVPIQPTRQTITPNNTMNLFDEFNKIAELDLNKIKDSLKKDD